ncbi:MAG: response regulator [Myxococcales bacterium]|nr:response regulator [Myxococcales bacterium]
MSAASPIRVVVVDDSPICSELLRLIVEHEGDAAVVGVANEGERGLEAVKRLRPDLVLLDLRMPGMDGLTLVERIMSEAPTPILVVTADPAGASREGVFEAVRRGALDVARKPDANDPHAAAALRRRVTELARVPVVRHLARRPEAPRAMAPPIAAASPSVGRITAVGIAASAGGPSAVAAVLSSLPASFPVPIALVQHLPAGFAASFATFLESRTALRPRVVSGPVFAGPGEVLLAETDAHLVLRADGRFDAATGEPVDGHRPSATVLFRSLADTLGARALGVILSGMGRDGVDGLAAMRARGARTIAQDRETSAVFGMPKAALESGAASEAMRPSDITQTMLALAGGAGGARKDEVWS